MKNTCLRVAAAALSIILASASGASAVTYSVIYSFKGRAGCEPKAGLVRDKAGNLYGTTMESGYGIGGTVFKITPDGKATVLHSFMGSGDGANPMGGVQFDRKGNLYGTTYWGGTNDVGVAFEVAADGSETILHNFGPYPDGGWPDAGVIKDSAGNLYGTTTEGGKRDLGTVFEIAADGTETVLYDFRRYSGYYPSADVTRDSAGNLYGTAGGGLYDGGIVFRIAPDRTFTTLYNFGGSDGDGPWWSSLKFDKAGNLYGTTVDGGATDSGVVFKLAPDGTETVLHSFADGTSDGASPYGGVVVNAAGNAIYGTTGYGGASELGTVFSLHDGKLKLLHSFAGGTDGKGPVGDLIPDDAGNLYGITPFGGEGACGTVFKVSEK